MLWGTTFSHKKAAALKLDPFSTFIQIVNLNFDYIRLGCYWDDIEPQKGIYNLSIIQSYLDYCELHHQQVILTIGRKAPHWPEFYFPEWTKTINASEVRESVYSLTEKVVQTCRKYTCITHWQIENEPLDPSGPDQLIIPLEELQHQASIVRRLDKTKKIIITVWGNDVLHLKLIQHIIPLCDIIGLDLYYKQFVANVLSKSFYTGPRQSDKELLLNKKLWNKPVWITELQAEPWEANNKLYQAANPKSINAILLEQNVDKAMLVHPETILLWGSEYWFWKKNQGDSRMWDTVIKFLDKK